MRKISKEEREFNKRFGEKLETIISRKLNEMPDNTKKSKPLRINKEKIKEQLSEVMDNIKNEVILGRDIDICVSGFEKLVIVGPNFPVKIKDEGLITLWSFKDDIMPEVAKEIADFVYFFKKDLEDSEFNPF